MIDYRKAVRHLLERGAPSESDDELASILSEAADKEASEIDGMSYLLKAEEFLDDCGIYSFKGWEDGIVLREPGVEKYWVSLELLLPEGSDMEAVEHISGRERDARITFKELDSGKIHARIRFLRRKLDEIEFRNKRSAEKSARPVAATPLSSPMPGGEVAPSADIGGFQ